MSKLKKLMVVLQAKKLPNLQGNNLSEDQIIMFNSIVAKLDEI